MDQLKGRDLGIRDETLATEMATAQGVPACFRSDLGAVPEPQHLTNALLSVARDFWAIAPLLADYVSVN